MHVFSVFLQPGYWSLVFHIFLEYSNWHTEITFFTFFKYVYIQTGILISRFHISLVLLCSNWHVDVTFSHLFFIYSNWNIG